MVTWKTLLDMIIPGRKKTFPLEVVILDLYYLTSDENVIFTRYCKNSTTKDIDRIIWILMGCLKFLKIQLLGMLQKKYNLLKL